MFDSLKMMPFLANSGFHSRLSLHTFYKAANQNAYDFNKHMDDILEQLHVNLLMF